MQDRADQQRMAGFFPVVALVETTLGVDQDIRDVLHITDFPFALPHLQQRVVSCGMDVGRIEEQHPAVAGAKARRQRPVLTFDVMDDAASRPSQQRRHDEADPLARPGGSEAKDMLRAVMAQILFAATAQHDAIGAEQTSGMDFLVLGPSRRPVGGDIACFARPDDRHEKGGGDGHDRAGCGNDRALGENARGICVEGKPPPEEGWGIIDWPSRDIEPRIAELGLKTETEGDPLRRGPDHHHDDGEHDNDLAPEYSASTHTGSNRQERWSRSENRRLREWQQERPSRSAVG